jgi:hypothetical protein
MLKNLGSQTYFSIYLEFEYSLQLQNPLSRCERLSQDIVLLCEVFP